MTATTRARRARATTDPTHGIAAVEFQLYTKLSRAGERGADQVPASDCWLYLFRQTRQGISFDHEVYIDKYGLYHEVDLDANRRDRRHPPTSAGTADLSLHSVDRVRNVSFSVGYWVLFFKKHLHPSRIPIANRVPSEKGSAAFMKWARDERDLEFVVLDPPGLDSYVFTLWTPWDQALAMARQLNGLVAEFQQRMAEPTRLKLRHLYAAVRAIEKTRAIDSLVDAYALEETAAEIKRDQALQDRCEQSAQILTSFLESPRYKAMLLDMHADDEQEAHAALIPIFTEINDLLVQTKIGRQYLQRFYDDNSSLFYLLDFSKAPRKIIKIYPNFIKAIVGIAIGRGHSERLARFLVSWAHRYAGAALVLENTIDPNNLRFAKTSIDELKFKASTAPALLNLILVLEIYNLAKKAWTLVNGKQHDLTQAVDFCGALASSASAVVNSLEGAYRSEVAEVVRFEKAGRAAEAKLLSPTADDIERLLAERMSAMRSSPAIRAGKMAVKSSGKILGVISGIADVWIGSVGTVHEWETGDLKSAIWPGITALGGLFALVGYGGMALGLTAFVALGPILILVGSILGVAAAILGSLLSSSELEDWLRHCHWGRQRNSGTTAEERWSSGPLRLFHSDPDKQLLALNEITIGFEIAVDYQMDMRLRRAGVVVKANFRSFESASVLHLEVIATDDSGEHVLHAFSPWRNARWSSKTEAHESFTVQNVRAVKVRAWLDYLGDGNLLHPNIPFEKTYH